MREYGPHLDNQRIEPSLIITLLSAPWELLTIFLNQNILRKLRHREISCLATQLGSIPPKEVPGFFKKTQHYPQVSLVKIHLGFNL